MITQERLKEVLFYSPRTGLFRWRISLRHGCINKIAGSRRRDGYICIRIDKRRYYAHRLAWFYMTGKWVPEIDHEDRNSSNKDKTHSDNISNSKQSKRSVTGLRGATPFRDGRYVAQICYRRKRIHLGYYNSAEEAHQVYLRKYRELRGEEYVNGR